jgi:TRAP-type C4-dicarboxylate transport system permease small subunit
MLQVDVPASVAGSAVMPDVGRLWVLDAALDVVVAVAIFGELAAVIVDVLGRTLFEAPLLWADEVGGAA